MDKKVSLEAEALGYSDLVDRAIVDLLAAGLDIRDPEIAASFAGAVTARLAKNSKRPFPEILQDAVKAVVGETVAQVENVQVSK